MSPLMVGPATCLLPPCFAGGHGDRVLAIYAQGRRWPGCAVPLPAVSFDGDGVGGHWVGLNLPRVIGVGWRPCLVQYWYILLFYDV